MQVPDDHDEHHEHDLDEYLHDQLHDHFDDFNLDDGAFDDYLNLLPHHDNNGTVDHNDTPTFNDNYRPWVYHHRTAPYDNRP